MERCIRCSVKEDKVQLFDVIYEGRADLMCERCSIIENITILKTPSYIQLREAEKDIGVYERLKKIRGYPEIKKQKHNLREERLREIEENPGLEHPEKPGPELIEYFHWEIMKNRRRKGLTQKKLAESIEESEASIEMLEKAIFPKNYGDIIKKLEQFFNIKLIKVREIDILLKKKEKKPVLLDENGNTIEMIPEPKIEEEPIEIDFDREDFNFSEIDTKKTKISDLMNIHRKKIDVTKQEKIEERNRLIEARKEEFRAKKVKESKELDSILGGAELLKKT